MDAEIFLQALGPTLGKQAQAVLDLEARLQGYMQQAQQCWPTIHVDSSAFVTHMAQLYVSHASNMPLDAWFSRLHASDLYILRLLVSNKTPEAIEAFGNANMLRWCARSQGVLRTKRIPKEDLLRYLARKAICRYTPTGCADPPLCGAKPFHSWLRVTATRTFLDCVRSGAQQKREHGADDDRLMNAPDLQTDVELDFLKRDI